MNYFLMFEFYIFKTYKYINYFEKTTGYWCKRKFDKNNKCISQIFSLSSLY